MDGEVSFFEVSTWTRLAEVCGEHLKQALGVRVVGRLKQDLGMDEDGETHSRVHIVAEHVDFKPQLKKDGDPDAKKEKPASVRRFRLPG